ncbi:hypothetical protein BaRGS_00038560, partial [Batillaria attramentaria]
KAVFQHAWYEAPSTPGCDKNCFPVVSGVRCLAGTGGAGCWQVVSAKDILHIYDRCKDNITGVSFQCDGIPGKIDAGVKCLEGHVVDPCKHVDYTNVFNISLVRAWKSLENRAVCHCQLQSRDWQNLSITVVNLYSGTGVNRTPTLRINDQESDFSVPDGIFPETTVSSEYNLNISFDPQDQAKEARQIVEIQASSPFSVDCPPMTDIVSTTPLATYPTTSPTTPPATSPTTPPATSPTTPVQTTQMPTTQIRMTATPRAKGRTERTKTIRATTEKRGTARPTTSTERSLIESKNGVDTTTIAVIVCSIVFAVLVTGVLVGCYIRRRRRNASGSRDADNDVVDRQEVRQPTALAANNAYAYVELSLSHGESSQSQLATRQNDDGATYGALHHGGGQGLAGASEGGAIYSHVQSTDIYNTLQMDPGRRVVVDNIYNTTKAVGE